MFRFKVLPEDGEAFEVEAGTRDIYMWERTTRDGGFNKLKSQMRTEDLYAVAYNAARRQDLFTGTLADFKKTCDFDILPDKDAKPPTVCPHCGEDLMPEIEADPT